MEWQFKHYGENLGEELLVLKCREQESGAGVGLLFFIKSLSVISRLYFLGVALIKVKSMLLRQPYPSCMPCASVHVAASLTVRWQ